MSLKLRLGWCLTGHCHECPYRVGGGSADYPEMTCICPCHEPKP